MAEAFLKKLGGNRFEVESAGLKPGILNPLAIEVMKEEGIDISQNKTKSVFDLFKQDHLFHYVITVCDESQSEKCPIFPGLLSQKINWSLPDPAGFEGTMEEKLAKTREVRNQIKSKIKEWLTILGL